MIASKTANLNQNLKSVADRVIRDKSIRISRTITINENTAMTAEQELNELDRLRRESTKRRTVKQVLKKTEEQAQINGISELTADDINEIISEVFV